MLLPNAAFAQGGAPLVTDDPGTPGNGRWEINSAVAWRSDEQTTVLLFPLLDINYGYGDQLQFTLGASWITFIPHTGGTESGLSLATVATKWRFIDEALFGVAVSTFPRIDFHHPLSSDNAALNSWGSHYFLPLEFSKELGPLGINPEIGYAWHTYFSSEWVYGLALSYTFPNGKEVLAEIHGRSAMSAADRELLYHFGTRYSLTDHLIFQGAFGRSFVTFHDALTSWDAYVGFQFRI